MCNVLLCAHLALATLSLIVALLSTICNVMCNVLSCAHPSVGNAIVDSNFIINDM